MINVRTNANVEDRFQHIVQNNKQGGNAGVGKQYY